MGIYAEYLDKKLNFQQLATERKAQLKRISELRGNRDVLVFAADLKNNRQPIGINYSDLLPLNDQLANLSGTAIDIILETPGGSGETVEDMVKLIRTKYPSMGVIVPGAAKSAGTIFAMAADEILMESASALGPIDAQITWQGKVFSAHALLEGMNKIKEEVIATGALNRAYIPILQNISPGELQHAQNAYDFARDLVSDWLVRYKFKDWTVHLSTGQAVTPEQRAERARQIADELRNHGKWKTHGRSIKIDDLRAMKLRIIDYSEQMWDGTRPCRRSTAGRGPSWQADCFIGFRGDRMPEFDIVFEKLAELTRDPEDHQNVLQVTAAELDEIEELRRFSSEIQEPEPPSFTTT